MGEGLEQPAPARTYRKRIRVETCAPGMLMGALEDTAHHVRVKMRFEGARVREVQGEPVRLPWVTCPGAAEGLRSLVGAEATTALRELRRHYDPASHCTHFFDLAHLVLAQAARNLAGAAEPVRAYEAVVPAPQGVGVVAAGPHTELRGGGVTTAALFRNGVCVLQWQLEGSRIIGPDPFTGLGLREGFLQWCEQHLDDERAEAAYVLRRVAGMWMIANLAMDAFDNVAQTGLPQGTCFTAQPERMGRAARNVGSQRDYSAPSAPMLEGYEASRDEWLSTMSR